MAAWTCRLISALLNDEQLVLPVAIYQPQYSGYVSFPAVLGRQGVGNLILLKLYPVEEMAIRTAAAAISGQLAALNELVKEGTADDN